MHFGSFTGKIFKKFCLYIKKVNYTPVHRKYQALSPDMSIIIQSILREE